MKAILITATALSTMIWAPISKVELQFSLAKGKVYQQIIEVSSQMKQTAMGQVIEINTSSNGTMSYEHKDNGVYDLWYNHLSMGFSAMGQAQQFDSDTSKLDMVDPMSSILSGMVGQKFQANIAPTGKVEKLNGLNELISKASSRISDLGEDINEQIRQSYGEDGLKTSIEMFTNIFPGKVVKAGDKWTKDLTTGGMMPMLSKTTYTLKSLNATEAILEVSGSLEIDPENKRAVINGMDALYFLEGERKGTLTVQVATGWITSGSIKDDVSGSITIAAGPGMPEDMTIPIEMVLNTKVKG